MPTQEKIKTVAEIKQLFEESTSFFVTDYQGLNVANMTALRKSMRASSVKYLIAKNTLLSLGAKSAGKEGLDSFFQGPTAVAFASEDPSVAAKILHDSFKAHDLPKIKVFVVEDQQHGPADVKRLAELPSREVLLSMVVAAVESPFSALVGSLDGFFRKLVGSIDALAEKRQSEG